MTRAPAGRATPRMSDLSELIRDLGRPILVVVGDVMLDRYVFGSVSRISPEAPIPVLHASRTELRPGGAASVAAMVVGLEARVRLVGAVGDDRAADALGELLYSIAVERGGLVRLEGRLTTVKTRMVAGGATHRNKQQLVRVDEEDTSPLDAADVARLIAAFEERLPGAGCVIVSDYAKGVISPELVAAVIARCRAAGVPVVVDPKGSDYTRYRGCTLLTPNRGETLAATGISPRDRASFEAAGRRLLEIAQCDAALVTLDKDGMALVEPDRPLDFVPTTPREVFDVTGAGDMVAATLGVALADGRPLADAVRLANLAAGVEVEKIGVMPVSRTEMREALARSQALPAGILSLDELLESLTPLRTAGARVVFTNGCFDVLHAGHARYLGAARRLGDVLIVGLNSDASVRRLKGPDRPVNPQEDRAELLASLAAVDYVVLFDEDDPSRLIEAIVPDVLVKGADWREKGVIGRDVVEAAGGQVVLIDLLEGRSTTNIVRRIRAQDSGPEGAGSEA